MKIVKGNQLKIVIFTAVECCCILHGRACVKDTAWRVVTVSDLDEQGRLLFCLAI